MTGKMGFIVSVAKTLNSAKSKVIGDFYVTLKDKSKYHF